MDVFARLRRAHAEQTVAWSITNAHQQAIRCSDLHVFDGAVDGWSSQAATDWPWAEEGAGRDEDIWLVGEEGLVVLKDALTGEEGTRAGSCRHERPCTEAWHRERKQQRGITDSQLLAWDDEMKQTGRDCHVRMLTRVLQSCPHHHRHLHDQHAARCCGREHD